MRAASDALDLPPLTTGTWLLHWHLDLSMAVLITVLAGTYLACVLRLRRRGTAWAPGATACFLLAGLGGLVLTTMSFLGAYNRVLFWPGAVENVLLLTLAPVALTLGRPVELLRRSLGPKLRPPRMIGVVLRGVASPFVGSVLAVGLLLALYTTSYDEATLRHPALLAALHLQLLVVGCLFYWPLLGVDAWSARMSYPLRAGLAFLDGLLDALPGLAVLGSRSLVAGSYYQGLGRTWGPTLRGDQRLAGTALVALSELVALPSLVVLLVAWARQDSQQADEVDRELDAREAMRTAGVTDPLDRAAAALERPWWETNPGPLSERVRREGWDRPAPGPSPDDP